MDLASIQPRTITIDIRHPETQQPIGLRVTLLPETDDRVLSARRRVFDRAREAPANSYDAIQQNMLELTTARVGGWEWMGETNLGGDRPECTHDNVQRVLRDHKWLRDQIEARTQSESGFFAG